MTKKRFKQPAAAYSIPLDKDDCSKYINQIGMVSRELTVLKAAMNDEIAAVTDSYTGRFTPLEEKLKNLQSAVQTWCEANRDELTLSGKVKTANFDTGSVQWRQRPPSVVVRGVESVIETLERLGLNRFIRPKPEINKEAILNEPAAVAGVAGLSIKKGVEDFVITPFEKTETS